MNNILNKVKKCLKSFVEIGGASSVVVFLIYGQWLEAVVCTVIFLLIVLAMEKYFT